MDLDKLNQIKGFWDSRAVQYGADERATLGERYLRRLEIRTMSRIIRQSHPQTVLDVGCGNGYSTCAFAQAFPGISFTGIDYSEAMIAKARTTSQSNARFAVGDVTNPTSLPSGPFDLIITQRCIQNLPDYETQRSAIDNLCALAGEAGHLVLMECSKSGLARLTAVLKRAGRALPDNVEPWHNKFLIDDWLMRDYSARVEDFSSTYMFLTRVLSSRLAPLALRLPAIGNVGYDRLYFVR